MVVSKDVTSDELEERTARSTDFALVVGVDHYPSFRPLSGAVADATRFHTWCCSPGGGGVDPANARLVVSRQHPAAPLQDEVDVRLVELMEAADALGGGRRLYFYFSGHGATSPDESGEDVALLLASWSRVRLRAALSNDRYRGELVVPKLFDEVVIFLDCCRSTAVHVVGLPPTFKFGPRLAGRETRIFVAYATEAGHPAFEVRDDNAWQGVFTKRLLTILERSPRGIEADALRRELERENGTGGQQARVLNGLREGSTFGTRGNLPELEIRFADAKGRVWLLSGKNVVIGEREAGNNPWTLRLEAGLYKLEHGAGPAVLIDHGREEVTRVVV